MPPGSDAIPIVETLALQFLAPAAGLIAAGLAIPAFLFFYFLKLRRRPMRVSTTLFWEQAVSDLQVNAPFRWLRPSVLFFVQLLALICLLLAVARPAIDGGQTSGRIVLLIDTSASMASLDTDQRLSRLELAKQDARALLEQLPSEVEVMVIAMAESPRTVTNFTRNRGLVRNAIDTIQQTDQPARLADALEVLAAFIRPAGEEPAADDETGPPRIVLLSDGAFPDPVEDRAVPGVSALEFEFRRFGPTLSDGEAEAAELATAPNIAVIGLSVRRDLDAPGSVRVFTRLQSTFQNERSVALRCSVNGETVAASSATIPGAASADGLSSEATFSFDIENEAGGLLAISVAGDDALEADNRAWLTLAPPQPLRILMIRPDGPLLNGSANLAFALETVYPPPQEVRVVTESEARASGQLLATAEGGFDLVVYDSVSPPSVPELPTLIFNAAPPVPRVSVSQPQEPTGSEFLFWRRSHPVMRNVVPDGVIIYRRSNLTVDDGPLDDAAMVVRTTELASDPQPLIVLLEFARTRSLVIGFALDNTTWWQDRSFPIFIQNAVDFLAPPTTEQSGRVITTSDPIRVSPLEAFEGASIVAADGSVIRVPSPSSEEAVLVPPLARVGVYELTPSQESSASPRLIPVSLLNRFESLSAAAPSIEIGGRAIDEDSGGGMARREIWNWLILAATVLLILEWILFDRKMRF
jgi:Mg-chelatase subunit ChlD